MARAGKPLAAVVSVEDLERLESAEVPAEASVEEREALFRRRVEEAGLVVRWSTGEPVTFKPLDLDGPPLSEEIIANRR